MINYIQNLFSIIIFAISIINKHFYQKRFIRKTLGKDLEIFKSSNDGSLDERDFRKITQIYGYTIPVLLGESFSLLRGRRMDYHERMTLTYLGGLTGLFDDYVDDDQMPDAYIIQLINAADTQIGKNSNEQLFIQFMHTALSHCSNVTDLKLAAEDICDAQLESKKQLDSNTSVEELKQITFKKGGNSFLFYRSSFVEKLTDAERIMHYTLGGLGQFENDLFDVYKDFHDGIHTVPTSAKQIADLRIVFKEKLAHVVELVHQTHYSYANKIKFLRFNALFLCSGFVCLDMLEKLTLSTGKPFNVGTYERKQLICDMEKPLNFFSSIHYYCKMNHHKPKRAN